MKQRKRIVWINFLLTKFATFIVFTVMFLVFGLPYRIHIWTNDLIAGSSEPAPVPSPSTSTSAETPLPYLSFSVTIRPGDPPATSCGRTCSCFKQGTSCTDPFIDKVFYCSHGLMLLKEEYEAYDGLVYLNRCKPPGKPELLICRYGETCSSQGISEGETCETEEEELALCRCGIVLNVSTPERREAASTVYCIREEGGCEEPEEQKSPIHL